MKRIFTFFRLWFGVASECWQDAKIIHDKKVQEAFKELSDLLKNKKRNHESSNNDE